jgi:hypothetical protein
MYGQMTLRLRSVRHKMPREQVLQQIHEASQESAQRMHDGISDMCATIQRFFSTNRVFCVTESCDNVVMWSHYAEEHRGVVFKLACIDEIDNTLLAAMPVRYTENFLDFPPADRYVRHLMEEEPFDMVGLCWEICRTKHSDWSYEREWRALWPLIDEPYGDGYSYFSENSRVFEAMYLGCRMAEEDKTAVVALAKRHLPEMKVFSAMRSSNSFSLDFQEI